MIAAEYLEEVKKIEYRLRTLNREREKAEEDLFNIKSMNYEKDRVTGGELADTCNKLERAEQILKNINEKETRLIGAKEEARARINDLQDVESVCFLLDYYINNMPLLEIERSMNISISTFYRKKADAISQFQKVHGKWLSSLTELY